MNCRQYCNGSRAPSFDTSPKLNESVDSSQVDLEHPKIIAYRCFLPDLTEFTVLRRPGPSRLRPTEKIGAPDINLQREFHPALADCGFRAPLAPRVAQPLAHRRSVIGSMSTNLYPVRFRTHYWMSMM